MLVIEACFSSAVHCRTGKERKITEDVTVIMSRMKENKGEKIEFEMLFCPIVYEYEKIK